MPNLPYQDLSSSIFNEDVSFHSVIKGRIRSRGAGAADPRVLRQKPGEHDSDVKGPFTAIYWTDIDNYHLQCACVVLYGFTFH